VAVVVCGGGDGGWTRWRCFTDASPLLFFSFSSVFFLFRSFFFFSSSSFLLLSVFLLFFSLFLCFLLLLLFLSCSVFFSSLLFFISVLSLPPLLLFFVLVCLLSPLYLEGKKETYTPAQSMAQGCRVDGAATVQPPLYHPRDTSPP
jgi:hypothetical protein